MQLDLLTYMRIAEEILQFVGKRETSKVRQRFYSTLTGVTQTSFRSIYFTLAITISVHPYILGIIPETWGKVLVGRSLSLKVICVENIMAAKEQVENRLKFKSEDLTHHTLTTSEIPSLVLRINCERKPKAIIVMEHRNFGYQSQYVKDNWREMILVIVSIQPHSV